MPTTAETATPTATSTPAPNRLLASIGAGYMVVLQHPGFAGIRRAGNRYQVGIRVMRVDPAPRWFEGPDPASALMLAVHALAEVEAKFKRQPSPIISTSAPEAGGSPGT